MAEFVSLADVLRPPIVKPLVPDDAPAPPQSEISVTAPASSAPASSAELLAVLREARLFRARLADAFDEARGRLLRELASGVLARELLLGPCDVDVLARKLCAEMPVVRVRVAPSETSAVRGVPVVADVALAVGDAIVEVADGVVDARLGVRLAVVLEAFG